MMPDLGINPSITISSEFFHIFKGSSSIRGKNKGKCEREDNEDEQAGVRKKTFKERRED